MAINNILVVCVGNICRSPMAKGILKLQHPNKHIESAGLAALVGQPASSDAIELMRINGLDISSHVAQQINEDMVLKSDLILTMTDNQTRWIISNWPYCRGKTFKLGCWRNKDIEDPYKRDYRAFVTAYEDISGALLDWKNRLN